MDDNSVDLSSPEQWPWRLALDSIPPPLLIIRPVDEIIEANAPLCLLFGLRRAELLGQPWQRFFPDARSALTVMLPAIAQRQINTATLETTLHRWNGTEHPVTLTLRPPRRDQDRGKDHVLCTVTAAGQANQQARLSLPDSQLDQPAALDQRIMESSLHGLALCDTSGRIHEVNETLCAMLGYHRQLLRQGTFSWLELAPFAKRAELHRKVQESLHGENEPGFETELLDATGALFPVLLTCHALDSRTPTHQALFFMAVTDLRPVKAEQALRELQLIKETESFWQSLFENMTEGLGILGTEGQIFMANQALLDLTGYTRDDVERGLSWHDVVAPDHLDMAIQYAIEVLVRAKGSATPLQADLLDAQGRRIPVLLRGSALPPSPQGEARLAVAFADISTLRQREAALLKERCYWQGIVSAVSEAIFVIDAHQLVHEANPAGCALLGINNDQLDKEPFALDWRCHLSPADLERIPEGLAQLMAGTGETSMWEATFVDAQGRERPVLIQGRLLPSPSAWAPQDAGPAAVLVITDITALKMREDAMAHAMAYWRTIFETAQDAMAILSVSGHIHEANPAFRALLTPTADQQAAQALSSWHALLPQDRLEEVLSTLQQALNTDAASPQQAMAMDINTAAGRTLSVLVRAQPLQRQAAWTEDRFVMSVVDVTPLKVQAQEIERKNRELEAASMAKTEFFAIMSHELRTPLNAIIGFSEMLCDGIAGPLLEEQQDTICEILKAGQRILTIVNNIMDLSELVSGRMELHLAPVDPGPALAAAVTNLRQVAQQKSIQMSWQPQENLPVCMVDERRFQQMIGHYLANALKFTPPGGSITIQAAVVNRLTIVQHPGCIGCTALSEAEHFLEICVADTGIGIAPEHQSRLFRSFEQVDSSLSRAYQGTGLGLALVKNLAERQGGAVGLVSSPGAGSRFYFWVPVATQTSAAQPHGPMAVSLP